MLILLQASGVSSISVVSFSSSPKKANFLEVRWSAALFIFRAESSVLAKAPNSW